MHAVILCVCSVLSLLQNSCQQKEKDQYKELMDTVNWFLFELLVLGYVEDPTSGASFRLPGGLCWAVYIEVREYYILYCVMSYLATNEIYFTGSQIAHHTVHITVHA